MKFLKNKLVDDESLELIEKYLSFPKDSDWIDGLKSFRGNPNTKNNKELINQYVTKRVYELLDKCIKSNNDFYNFCFPKDIDNILITKTERGGYYHPHVDIGFNGHLSTTVFLSDPNSYEGGELSLYIDGSEHKIKLEAGHAVTYSTGIPHKVNEVLSGERIVAVFWTKSIFKDPTMREVCSELASIELGDSEQFIIPYSDFDKVLSQNAFKITNILNKLIRTYGDI